MTMTFHEFQAHEMRYDPELDGVWIDDEGKPAVFLGRNTIIKALGLLPAEAGLRFPIGQVQKERKKRSKR